MTSPIGIALSHDRTESVRSGLFSKVLLFLLFMFWGASSVAQAQDERILDEIVAVVGNHIILQSEVDGAVMAALQQQELVYSDDLWNEALSQMVNEKVLTIHAKRDTNLVITDQQVDQMLDSRIEQMQAQVGGQARMEELYGRSIIEIKSDLREEFRDMLLADEFRRQKTGTIKATPTDIADWFEAFPTDSLPSIPDMVRVSHIVRLPVVTEEARTEAMEIITAARDSVIAGVISMEDMAELFSDDPGSASNGGLYEDMSLSEVVPEFAAVAARSPIAAYSRIFETQFGLHFLRVNARRGENIDYNHILISFDERKVDEKPALERLALLRDSIMTSNGSFEVIASVESEEEFSKSRGGRVTDPQTGERSLFLEALGALWQRTLVTMEEGDISEPVEVQLLDGRRAFHLVLLEQRIDAHVVNIDTDYDLIAKRALSNKQGVELAKWIETLKTSVYIDLRGKARTLIANQ